jgi:hypothetical protein
VQPELPDHARTAVRVLEFDMDGLSQRQHLRIRQMFPLRVAPHSSMTGSRSR